MGPPGVKYNPQKKKKKKEPFAVVLIGNVMRKRSVAMN